MDRYEVLKVIGRGSYGCCLCVRRLGGGGSGAAEGGDVCAIKQVRVEGLTEAERGAVLNEARIMVALKHPNIVCLLDPCFIQGG